MGSAEMIAEQLYGFAPHEIPRPLLPEWLNQPEMDTAIKTTNWGVSAFGYNPAITIAKGNFGEITPNQKLINEMIANFEPKDHETVRKTVMAPGIETRYRSPKGRTVETVIDDTARIAAHALNRACLSYGQKPDTIITSNLDLPTKLNDSIKRYAALDSSVGTKSMRAACAGGLLGLIEALANPEYRDGRVVAVISAESTGSKQDQSHYEQFEHLAIPAMFTDMFTVMLLRPSDFVLEKDFKIRVVSGGGINVQTFYEDAYQTFPDAIPSYLEGHIEFAPGSEGIFHTNDSGMYLEQIAPKNGMTATMDNHGKDTGHFFGTDTAPFIDPFLGPELNYEYIKPELEEDKPETLYFYHQPSKPVITRTNKVLWMHHHRGIQSLTFSLPEMNTGNGTSATSIAHLQYMLEQKYWSPKTEFVGLAMGIGAVFAALRFRKKTPHEILNLDNEPTAQAA